MDKRKREARRLAKQQQKLAELLGISAPPPDAVIPPSRAVEDVSREAEAALAYYDDPDMFERRECKECGSAFMVNRRNVAYCSDNCRKDSLLKLGIVWDNTKSPAERWKMNWQAKKVYEPLVVPGHVADIINSARPDGPVALPEASSPSSTLVWVEECESCGDNDHTFEKGCKFYFELDV